jgi:solute carrier family 25 folate transporter 32
MSRGEGTSRTESGTFTSSTFARATPKFGGTQEIPITPFETFCMNRSESSFNALAGAVGGFASGVVTCPLDVIKTKLQAQGGFRKVGVAGASPTNAVYNGMLGTARVIWREEGLRGMYRGLGPIILGYLPTWAVWFTVYGKSKVYFSKTQGRTSTFAFAYCVIKLT